MNSGNESNDFRNREETSARRLAHRLIDSHRSESGAVGGAARAVASACDDLYRELSRWVGPDGCRALFVRALAEARTEHPALAGIQILQRSELPGEDRKIVIPHADAVTEEALESMLVRLVELLGRLIGDDVATTLIERSLNGSEVRDSMSIASREKP